MKLLLTTFIITAIGALAVPSPQATPCTKICHLEKPVCPAGQAPTGGEGCWGCCEPIPVVAERASDNADASCTAVCRTVKPVCPSGQSPSGSPGCWGCCKPVSPVPNSTRSPCLAVCVPTEPVCPEGEAATGGGDCWGCCQPIGSF
jgi:hypothetical protein